MYIRVCAYVRAYVRACHECVHACVHACACVRAFVRTYVRACVRAFVRICEYVYMAIGYKSTPTHFSSTNRTIAYTSSDNKRAFYQVTKYNILKHPHSCICTF